MGFFDFLFGKKAPPHLAKCAREEVQKYYRIRELIGDPFTQEVDSVMVKILYACEAVPPGTSVSRNTKLMELIGGDEIDVVELTMTIEDQFDGRVKFQSWADEQLSRITVGDLISEIKAKLGR